MSECGPEPAQPVVPVPAPGELTPALTTALTPALTPRGPDFARVSLAVVMSAREANLLGNIHGGEIVKFADSTAGAVAQRHSGGPAVTAALDEMAFLAPVHVGDIVRTFSQVNWAGRSSMEVGVRVEAQPWNDSAAETVHVASAYFVFVAVDAAGRPRPIPPLLGETPVDVRRVREAEIRRSHRLARKEEIARGRSVPVIEDPGRESGASGAS